MTDRTDCTYACPNPDCDGVLKVMKWNKEAMRCTRCEKPVSGLDLMMNPREFPALSPCQ